MDLVPNTTANNSFNPSELVERIVRMKIRMLNEHPFFGLLVQHLIFAVDEEISTACTDGERIYFSPQFCSQLDDDGLYYVTLHEIMHVVLGHCFRGADRDNRLYNIACDIVVNSTIMGEYGFTDIDLGEAYGKMMHKAPDGKEGRIYTAEDVYAMFLENAKEIGVNAPSKNGESSSDSKGSPSNNSGNNSQNSGQGITAKERARISREEKRGSENTPSSSDNNQGKTFEDDHSRWGSFEKSSAEEGIWKQRVRDAVSVMSSACKGWGNSSSLASRVLKDMTPILDWRVILNNFIQEDVIDYSFASPDRRFQDSSFILPSFSEVDASVRNIWIAVDASGSVSQRELSQAISEIKNAIGQFSFFEGYLSYFDSYVTRPIPFSSVREVDQIPSLGGGGTSFVEVLDYRRKKMADMDISLIIIITDGYAPWPKEGMAEGIPVLWIINNKSVTPPWGVVARMV